MAAADLQSAVLEMFAGLEADERLAGQGLAEAFAEAFPAVPAASAVPSLKTSTSWARVAALLGVSSLSILDVTQAHASEVPAAEKVTRLRDLVGTTLRRAHTDLLALSSPYATPGSVSLDTSSGAPLHPKGDAESSPLAPPRT